MSIQVLQMFGYLPNMLEVSCNICTQGCTYCYAKYWKHETVPIDKIVNSILSYETKKEGVLPFLIRKRSPITISNRTDLLTSKNWQDLLYALKKLGFPLYLETKLNKEYKDLIQILDLKKDTVYQTITGFNNKHEEKNILSAEEKIEAAKWLNENGIHHILAVNPFLPDKVTVEEIKKMIEIIKPAGFVMRDYHKTSKSVHKHLYMPEFPKELNKKARIEMKKYCMDNNIVHDIDYGQDFLQFNPHLNLRLISNRRSFGSNHFVNEKTLSFYIAFENDEKLDRISYYFEDYLEDHAKEIEYFKDCIFKSSDYPLGSQGKPKKWKNARFNIYEFLQGLWNDKKLTCFDYYTEVQDKEGNLIYGKDRKTLIDLNNI